MRNDITKLSSGQRLLDGKWMNQAELAVQTAPQAMGDISKPISFTTKGGGKFVDARVSLTDTGLSVLTADGGTTIPLDQLPDDLSAFPDTVRKGIVDRREVRLAQNRSDISPTLSPIPKSQPVVGNSTAFSPPTQNDQSTSATSVGTVDVATAELSLTKFESTVLSNFTAEQIRNHLVRGDDKDYVVPAFSDDLPPTQPIDGKNATDTIQFMNRKMEDWQIIYYDASMKTFVTGSVVFTSTGRIRLEKCPIVTFNPADLNPDKIQQSASDNQILVWASTTNNKKSIGIVGLNGTPMSSDGFALPVEDDMDAQSMGHAMTHLIQLYGGKPEEF